VGEVQGVDIEAEFGRLETIADGVRAGDIRSIFAWFRHPYCCHTPMAVEAVARIEAAYVKLHAAVRKLGACGWCSGTGTIPATGVLCHTCEGSGLVAEARAALEVSGE
jgi:hypothetical protein